MLDSTPVNSSGEFGTSGVDISEVRRWLLTIHASSPGLIWVGSTSNWEGFTSSDVDGAVANVLTLERDNPQGIYLRTTTLSRIPIKDGKRGRGEEGDSFTLPGFAADLDIAGPGHKTSKLLPPDTATAMSIVDTSGLPEPTIWVHSGGGVYPWWLLDDPQDIRTPEALARAKTVSEQIQKILVHAGEQLGWHVGGEVGDMARVLRIPGTINRKQGLARPCHIMEPPSYEHYAYAEIESIVENLFDQIPKPAPREFSKTTRPLNTNGTQVILPGDDLNARGDWNWILAGHFTYVKTKGGTDYWLRVGSESGAEHSATTGYARDEDRFYTWSSESVFQARKAYNKHAAYTLINFGSLSSEAFRQSTKQLAAEGFGSQLPELNRPVDVTSLVKPAAPATPVLNQAVDHQQPEQAALAVQTGQVLAVAAAHDDLPEIDLGSEQEAMLEISRVIATGLIPNLYVKDGQLVHVHPKTNSACSEVTVVPVTADLLNMLLAEHTRTFKWVSGGKDNPPVRKACAPAITHLRAVVSKTYWPTVPELTGVVGTPTLRPDGTLIQDCGFDQATGLFYGPAVTVARVPETISDEQVRRSREFVFSKVFGEFCWSSAGDFANYMALLLSPMLRPYVKTTTPFGMVTATTRGSGKTNLTDAIGLLYGQTSQVLPGRTEELQKKVTSILAGNSSPVVVFDNLKEGSTISSEILATLITKDKWDDRMLGASRNIEATNDRLWLASGNGLTVGGDMASRTVMVRLDPKMAKPELRQFEMGQFSDWIREPGNRENLLWHLLILVQAWVKDGAAKDESHTMRGFTKWAQIMGGLLVFHGLTGFLGNADDLAARDTDEEEWGIFLAKWYEVFGPSEQMARQVHASAQVDWVMGTSVDRWSRCFITDDDGLTPTPKKLGHMLHGKADRFFGKYILRKRKDSAINAMVWWVEKVEEGS